MTESLFAHFPSAVINSQPLTALSLLQELPQIISVPREHSLNETLGVSYHNLSLKSSPMGTASINTSRYFLPNSLCTFFGKKLQENQHPTLKAGNPLSDGSPCKNSSGPFKRSGNIPRGHRNTMDTKRHQRLAYMSLLVHRLETDSPPG